MENPRPAATTQVTSAAYCMSLSFFQTVVDGCGRLLTRGSGVRSESSQLGLLVSDTDPVVVGELAAERAGDGEGGHAEDGQCQLAPARPGGVGGEPPGEVARERGGDDQGQSHVQQRGAVRRGATGDGQEVEESDGRRGERTEDTDADQPAGPGGKALAPVDPRGDVEDQAADPGADGDGDEDGVERVPVRAGQRGGDRSLRAVLDVRHGRSSSGTSFSETCWSYPVGRSRCCSNPAVEDLSTPLVAVMLTR